MKSRGLFVTGTDTGVGKTLIAAMIGASWSLEDRAVVRVLKPAETGCPLAKKKDRARSISKGELVPADALRLADFAGDPRAASELCPFRFAEPLAPAVAAARAELRDRTSGESHDPPTIEDVSAAYLATAEVADRVIVEGAGGVLVPYGPSFMGIDIAVQLDLPVLVVARLGLGTINHTLLTVEEIRRRELTLIGVVLSGTDPAESVASRTNRETVAHHLADLFLGAVPYLGPDPLATMSRDDAARTLAEHIDVDRLRRRMGLEGIPARA